MTGLPMHLKLQLHKVNRVLKENFNRYLLQSFSMSSYCVQLMNHLKALEYVSQYSNLTLLVFELHENIADDFMVDNLLSIHYLLERFSATGKWLLKLDHVYKICP